LCLNVNIGYYSVTRHELIKYWSVSNSHL
jgi:hypothetical protein